MTVSHPGGTPKQSPEGPRPASVGRVTVAGVVAILTYVMLLAAAGRSGVSVEQAVADPQESTGLRLLGIVSNVGVLLWTAVVTTCFLGASVLPQQSDGTRRFLRASGSVAMILLLDDFLLIHEYADDAVGFFVEFEHTRDRKDLLELTVFAAYGLIVSWYLLAHRAVIAGTDRLPLRLAGANLATSLLIDIGVADTMLSAFGSGMSSRTETLLEEGAKLVGIAYLTLYFLDTTRLAIRSTRRQPSP